MVDFLMMFSLCICVLSGVTLLIVHIWSKKKQKKEEAEDKTGGTVFHSGTRNVPKPIKERAGTPVETILKDDTKTNEDYQNYAKRNRIRTVTFMED